MKGQDYLILEQFKKAMMVIIGLLQRLKINNNKTIKKSQNKKKVGKIINNITDYKGLWKPILKSISKMSKKELINNVKKFRNDWEIVTTRNQDLSDERLKNE